MSAYLFAIGIIVFIVGLVLCVIFWGVSLESQNGEILFLMALSYGLFALIIASLFFALSRIVELLESIANRNQN